MGQFLQKNLLVDYLNQVKDWQLKANIAKENGIMTLDEVELMLYNLLLREIKMTSARNEFVKLLLCLLYKPKVDWMEG